VTRLLLVEDEAISRFQLSQFLTEEGYTVIPLATGEEALKILKTESFDVVITDFKLASTVDGIAVLTQFERVSPGKGKILMTAYPAHEVRPEAVGAIYIPKPVELENLLLQLKSILA
jgi:DNA-binding NtrC family response regulator